jgi:hypothetical protein
MSAESKRYSDREVARIIEAALDVGKKEGAGAHGGLLRSDIEAIARETGIPADHVRLALEGAAEGGGKGLARRLLGSGTTFERQETLPRSLTRDELDSLSQSLPALANLSEAGVAKGEAVTWRRGILKTLLDGFPLSLSVHMVEEGTEIRAKARLGSVATFLFAVSGGVGVLAGMKLSLAAMLLVGIGTIGLPTSIAALSAGGLVGLAGAWLLARLAFRAFVKRSKEKVAAVMERIKASITSMRA